MNNIYFGHPTSTYNTELEEYLENKIDDYFDAYVVNPSRPHYQQQYEQHGMDYFLNHVLQNVDAGIFHPFNDNTYGAGQTAEAAELLNQNKTIYQINTDGNIDTLFTPLTLEQTRKKLDGEDTTQ